MNGGIAGLLGDEAIRNAAVASAVVAAAAGATGYFVVLRNQVFTADALGHVAFTGALAALLAGVDMLAGLFGGTVAVGLLIAALGGRTRTRDVAVGSLFAWISGVGVLCLSLYTASAGSTTSTAGISVLFGSVLSLRTPEVAAVAVASGAVIAVLGAAARPLLFASTDPDAAEARGVPVRALGGLFLGLVGVTVASAVPVVGALIVFALMVSPAAAAQSVTARPYAGLILAMCLAVASALGGVLLSVAVPAPPSFLITAIAVAIQLAAGLRAPRARIALRR